MLTRRRCLGWICALVLLTFTGDRALAFILGRVVLHSQLRFSRLYRGGLAPDVLVLGNSRGVNAFYAPRLQEVTGRSVLNLSYNGVSTELAAAIFEDYLDHNRAPEVLVFEVTNVYSGNDALHDLRLYRNVSPRLLALDRRYDPSEASASAIAHLFDFNNDLFVRALYYRSHSDQSWINHGHLTPDVVASIDTLHGVELALPDANVAALQRIIERARRAGVRVELVVSPFLPAYRAKLVNYDQWMQVIRSKVGGTRIWDFSGSVSEASAFGDRIHLNRQGSDRLLTQMVDAGLFARTNPAMLSR